MYKQEKEYVYLTKEANIITQAGFRKCIIRDKKIRIEYFLKNLPVICEGDMMCKLAYKLEDGEIGVNAWKDKLLMEKRYYLFAIELRKEVDEIKNIELILPGEYRIVKKDFILKELKEQEAEEKPEEKKEATIDVCKKPEYVRDLYVLEKKSEELKDLAKNAFLLHGFYQYRYLVLAKNYIGVPDHFHEREAIAAKMMGFPYFIEAEYLEDFSFAKHEYEFDNNAKTQDGMRKMPKTGCFGYFLRKINLCREDMQKES